MDVEAELAVDPFDPSDLDILNKLAGVRVDRDQTRGPFRAMPFMAPSPCGQRPIFSFPLASFAVGWDWRQGKDESAPDAAPPAPAGALCGPPKAAAETHPNPVGERPSCARPVGHI